MSASGADAGPDPPAAPATPLRRRGERVIVRAGTMVHGGACVAHTDSGDTVIVEGAIPGELVEAELTRRSGGTWLARTVSVREPSPDRVTPPCAYVPECGGCQLQHIAYARQADLKEGIVRDALRRARVDPGNDVRLHRSAQPWRYRWRGDLSVVRARGERDAGLGFKRAHSWEPIAVDDCLIHHEAIGRSLPGLRDAVRRGGSPTLTALHLTVGDGGRELLIRARPQQALDVATLATVRADTDSRRLRSDGGDDDGDDLPLWNTDSVTLRWRDHLFRVRPDTFIQVNQGLLEVLYGCALRALGPAASGCVVDAYAGVGMLAVAIADTAREVVCIESNRASARLGVLNARINAAEARITWRAQAVEDAIALVGRERTVDAVVLDPPRAGCDPRVTGWLALAGPPRIVYISCDPATLARDLRVLAGAGPYRIASLDVVDMFPQTYHVESVVALYRDDAPGSDGS